MELNDTSANNVIRREEIEPTIHVYAGKGGGRDPVNRLDPSPSSFDEARRSRDPGAGCG